jgi:hypothetical protein
MALRDEEQHLGKRAAGVTGGLSLRDILSHLPAILVVAGLLMYAYLSICYDRFYGSLGVDPNDVSLSYAGTIARSSGFAVTVVFIVVAGPLNFLIGVLANWRSHEPRHEHMSQAPKVRSFVALFAIYLVVGILVFLPFSIPLTRAGDAATDVKAGKPVGPVRTPKFPPLWQLPVLAIRADPATIEPAGKPGDSPAAERLRGRRLLYLGKADGTVVFYDPAAQQAVYVPADSTILHVANCKGEPPDPACRQY